LGSTQRKKKKGEFAASKRGNRGSKRRGLHVPRNLQKTWGEEGMKHKGKKKRLKREKVAQVEQNTSVTKVGRKRNGGGGHRGRKI